MDKKHWLPFWMLSAFLLVSLQYASPAFAVYTQSLGVPHINLDDQPIHSSSAVSSLMTLRYEGQGDALTLQTVFDYGRSIDPSFLPADEMNEDMVAATLNHFETHPSYHYVPIRASTFADATRQAAQAIARVYPGATPGNLPVLIPLGGGYTHWVVVTGVLSQTDPSEDPAAVIYGFWLDDPASFDIDPEGNPIETKIFYSIDPSAPNSLQNYWQPMPSGDYVAVIPIFEPNLFQFDGFYQPVDNSNINEAKAGQAIPFKWRLTDTEGNPIADPASFVGLYSYPLDCTSLQGDSSDAIEEYAPGNSGLQYKGDGYWQFNWKTPKHYASTCRSAYVMFNNNQISPVVTFKFKK